MALFGGHSLQHLQRLHSGSQCCSTSSGLRPAPRLPSLPTPAAAQPRSLVPSPSISSAARPLLSTAGQRHLTAKFRRRGGEGAAPRRGELQVAGSGPAGGMNSGGGGGNTTPVDTPGKQALVGVAVGYMSLIVLIPFIAVFVQAFSKGFAPFVEHLTEPDFIQAVKMTVLLALVAVPVNVVFGTAAAIFLARNDFPGKVFAISVLDLPFSISPVVTGMMFVLLYGRKGLFAPLIQQWGFPIIFAFPGMALATMFVTMPFVVRELLPILEQMDPAEEEAARSLGANDWEVFWNVTLPNIKWGLMYGVILTNARAMGEFGAVSVVSGNIVGQTQTMTLYIESAYKEYQTDAAFAAAVILSSIALGTLIVKDRLEKMAGENQK